VAVAAQLSGSTSTAHIALQASSWNRMILHIGVLILTISYTPLIITRPVSSTPSLRP